METRPTPADSEVLRFGSFTLWPETRLLQDGLGPVQIGSRALDLLIALIRNAGNVIDKQALMRAVWPDVSVAEGSLRVQMTALRKLLGSGDADARYIVNVAGRGYSFVAPVSRVVATGPTEQRNRLAATRCTVFGRDQLVHALSTRLEQPVLSTLVGPGGIGKTTVAREVSRAIMRSGLRDLHWIDLSHVGEDQHVAEAVALTVGLKCSRQDAVPALIALLRARASLLVLDCCERAIHGVALLVERLLDELPDLAILATSREALRAQGEQVTRLEALSVPVLDQAMTATSALEYAAIGLFVERAAALGTGFVLRDADVPTVVGLCAKLDGLPLAIELAAGHMVGVSLHQLAALLAQNVALADVGRRTAEERHRTIHATLDWSYGLLSPSERLLLARLSIFEGGMTFAAITAVTAHDPLNKSEVLRGVARLVDKSLLALRTTAAGDCYRLLDTTRAYALERLREAGELLDTSRRHARYLSDEISRSQRIEGTEGLALAWFGPGCPNVSNLRAALGWALASPADSELALELVDAALPLWLQLSMHAECEIWAEQGLHLLRTTIGSGSEREMRFSAFLGSAMLGTRGPVEPARSAMQLALELAEQRGDPKYRGLTLSGLYWLWVYRGESERALDCAQRIGAVAAELGDETTAQISANYSAMATTQRGDQALAHARLILALDRASTHVDLGRFMRVGSDPTVFMRVFLIKVLWLIGESEQARSVYEGCVGVLRQPEHALYNCWALNEVMIPFFCFHEEWAAARGASEELQRAASSQSMSIRAHAARCVALAIDLLEGAGDLELFDAEVSTLRASRFCSLMPWLDGVAVTARKRLGKTQEALARVEQAIAESSAATNDWWLAELTRMRAELLACTTDPAQTALALDCALEARAIAQRQGALTLELRAAETCALVAG